MNLGKKWALSALMSTGMLSAAFAQTLNIPQDQPAMGPILTDGFTVVNINNVELTSGANGLDRGSNTGLTVNIKGANGVINVAGIGIATSQIDSLRVNGGVILGDEGINVSGGPPSITNDFWNSANITANANAIAIGGVGGDFTNNGAFLSVDNGILVYQPVGGNFTNNGMGVTVNGISVLLDSVGGNFRNTGDLSSDNSLAVLIYGGGVTGDFYNSGDIMALAQTAVQPGAIGGDFTQENSTVTGSNFGFDIVSVGGDMTIRNSTVMATTFHGVQVQNSIAGDLYINPSYISGEDTGFYVGNNIGWDVTIKGSEINGNNGYGFMAGDIGGSVNLTNSQFTGGMDGFNASSIGVDYVIRNTGIFGTNFGVSVGTNIGGNVDIYAGPDIYVGYSIAGLNDDAFYVGGDINGWVKNRAAIGGGTDGFDVDGSINGHVFNWGEFYGNSSDGFQVTGQFDYNFYNYAGASIIGQGDDGAQFLNGFNGGVFYNAGDIEGEDDGVVFAGFFNGTFNNAGGYIYANTGDAVFVNGWFSGDFYNRSGGFIESDGVGTAININGSFTGNLYNYNGALVYSYDGQALYVDGAYDGMFDNAGAFDGFGDAVSFNSTFTGMFYNRATGVIYSDGDEAVQFGGDVNGDIYNWGVIDGGDEGILFIGASAFTGDLHNWGYIYGLDQAVRFLPNNTMDGTLYNYKQGMIVGDGSYGIALGSGNFNIGNWGYIYGADSAIMKQNDGEVSIVNEDGTIMSDNDVAVNLAGTNGSDSFWGFGGYVGTTGSNRAISTGDDDDNIWDMGGDYANGGGSQVINTGGQDDTGWFFGSNVIRDGVNGGYQSGVTVQMGGGDDYFVAQSWFNFSGTVNGGGSGGDVIELYVLGVSAALQYEIMNDPATGVNADWTLAGTGDLRAYGIPIDWTNFEGGTDSFITLMSYQSLGNDPTTRNVGWALDEIRSNGAFPSADMQDVLTALDYAVMTDGPGAAPGILYQFSPVGGLEGYKSSTFNNSVFFGSTIYSQTERLFKPSLRLRFGSIQIDDSQLELVDPTQDLMFQRTDRRLASLGLASGLASDVPGVAFGGMAMDDKVMYDDKKMMMPLDDPNRFGIWLAGQGILADVDATDINGDDYGYDSWNVSVGLDYRVTQEFVVGALFNYGNTEADYDGNGSNFNTDTYVGGVYAGYDSADSGFFANAYVVGGVNDLEQDRRIVFGAVNRTASSDSDGWQLSTGAQTGYLFDLDRAGNWQAGPVAGLTYTYLENCGYTETGAGALNLTVNSWDTDSLRSALGGKLRGRWQLSNDVALEPVITAQWLHEFLDDSTGITSAFNEPAAGSFTSFTGDPDRDYGLVGLELNFLVGEEWSAFLSYNAQFSGDYLGNAITGGARFEF